MSGLPAPVVAIFERQHGVAGRCQLLQYLTEPTVDSMLRHGRLLKVERGVYRIPGCAQPVEQEPMAALLRARPDARLTGARVLGLLGIEGFDRDGAFTVFTAPRRHLTGVSFDHRPDPVPDRKPTPIGPLACVHPLVALVDAIVPLGRRERRVAMHVLRRRGHWSDERFAVERAARGDDDPGIAVVLGLIADGVLVTDSPEEDAMGERLLAIDDRFEPQIWITPAIRVDWLLRTLRLGFEYQGDVDHGDELGRVADEERFAAAAAAGVQLIAVTAADLRDPGFEAWVRGLIAARTFELSRPAR